MQAKASKLEYFHGCPICAESGLREYCRTPSLFNQGEFLRYDRCGACGVVFRNPRLPAEERLDSYASRLFPGATRQQDPRAQVHYWYMIQRLGAWVRDPSTTRLLDFGCGAGGFLLEAKRAGYPIVGLELNRDLAQQVQTFLDAPVHQGMIDDASFANEKFGVILSSQVFEHLLDPRATLRQLREHLTSPRLVLIEVPNLRDIREKLRRGSTMDDSHLFYFDRTSLPRMLESEGFEVLHLEEGLRLYRPIAQYARRVPVGFWSRAERLMAWSGVCTALSVVARLRP